MSVQTSNIAVVILAAGASKRMGSPKQLLKWGDNSLIVHSIETALKLNTKEIIVVLGAYYELIKAEIEHFPVTILRNKNWEVGLGKSIACASNYLVNNNKNVEGLIITLADQPLISSNYLEQMIQSFSKNEGQIIASAYNDKIKGVPVLFDKRYFSKLTKLKDDKGAKALLKDYESFIKALIPPVKNVDLDSKEDYEKLYKVNFNI